MLEVCIYTHAVNNVFIRLIYCYYSAANKIKQQTGALRLHLLVGKRMLYPSITSLTDSTA